MHVDEHLANGGTETSFTAVCFGGTRPDDAALRRLIDAAAPGIKGQGFSPERIRAAMLARGGVIIEYRGRRYHSPYLAATGAWSDADGPVNAYAVIVG
ncbi:MAG TPA: hypothetical protein VGN14_19305, partial [Candidatus Elarobacter sp.]